jgi:hypothetical protein
METKTVTVVIDSSGFEDLRRVRVAAGETWWRLHLALEPSCCSLTLANLMVPSSANSF